MVGVPQQKGRPSVRVSHHSDLIDTTEMYLRTVYELEEEGVVPLRARIAERLGQSGPTVSQTVARMERDGLLTVADDRHLLLTDQGRREAIAVMRKHRLAERLLSDVIGLEWDQLHIEACRWEHVMSDAVERRILALLDKPLVCPHGNPIPGLGELGLPFAVDAGRDADLVTLTAAGGAGEQAVRVSRISEQIQSDAAVMRDLTTFGILPGRSLALLQPESSGDQVRLGDEAQTLLARRITDHVFVSVS